MGSSGTGISSSDAFADVYSEFFSLYNDGLEIDEITNTVIDRNQEMLSIPEEANDFWFALAKAQWECKGLQPRVYAQVKTIVETGHDLKIWTDLSGTKGDLDKRRTVLEKFLVLLQSERPNAKRRKKTVIREPIFKKGDCLTYKLSDENYGGALVLEAEYRTELGLNLVAVTRINQKQKPSEEEFKKAEVLIKNFAKWDEKPAIIWLPNYKPREVKEFVEVVGSINIERQFLSIDEKHKYPYTSGWTMTLVDGVNLQFESERVKLKPKHVLPIKRVLKNGILERLFRFSNR